MLNNFHYHSCTEYFQPLSVEASPFPISHYDVVNYDEMSSLLYTFSSKYTIFFASG